MLQAWRLQADSCSSHWPQDPHQALVSVLHARHGRSCRTSRSADLKVLSIAPCSCSWTSGPRAACSRS